MPANYDYAAWIQFRYIDNTDVDLDRKTEESGGKLYWPVMLDGFITRSNKTNDHDSNVRDGLD